MPSTKNPLHAIRLCNQHQAPLQPGDFAADCVSRVSFHPKARRLHAMLRVVGFSAAESFMAAFGKGYIAHPDALALAADHYETTLTFKRELKEALETVDPQARDNELERHVEMYSAAANDAAMHLRVALNAYEPEEYRYSNDAHQTAFAAILELRKEEIEERAHGRSCVTLTEHEERQNALFGRSFE